MTELFTLVRVTPAHEDDTPAVCLAVTVSVGGRDTMCPVSEPCMNLRDLERAVQIVGRNLNTLVEEARAVWEKGEGRGDLLTDPDMTCEQMWKIFSSLEGEDEFVRRFNELEEARREALADYILTSCNVFSGKGAFFSARYDSASARIE